MLSRFEFKKSVIVIDPCYAIKEKDYHGVWGDKKTYNFKDGQVADMMFVMSTVVGDGWFPTEGIEEATEGNVSDKSLPVDSGTIAIINGASESVDYDALEKWCDINYFKFDGDGYAIIDDSCVRKGDSKLESYYVITLCFDDGRMYEFKLVLWYGEGDDSWNGDDDE